MDESVLDKNVSTERFKRFPAKEVDLDKLSGSMKRVCLLGRVSAINEDKLSAEIDDGKTKVFLEFEEKNLMNGLEAGGFYRVIGKPFFKDNEVIVFVEAIHLMNGLDFFVHGKVKELEKVFYG